MKKLVFSTIALALIATSCADKNAYTISGTIEAPDNTVVYLNTVELSKSEINDGLQLDSAIVTEGKFEIKGSAKKIEYASLTADGKRTFVLLEPGTLTANVDNALDNNLKVYYAELDTLKKQINDLRQQMSDANGKEDVIAELREKGEGMYQKLGELSKNFITANAENITGVLVFANSASSFSAIEQKEILDKLNTAAKEFEPIQKIARTAIGAQFLDLKAKDPAGNDIALADFAGKGKVVLVDFWASWCPPCRADMPELVKMYEEYKGKDFEIVGISLDREHEAWVKGIEELNITWPQISDIKFWDSELSAAYGVRSIPHTVLIDKDGTIVARGLRGEELAAKIAEFVK